MNEMEHGRWAGEFAEALQVAVSSAVATATDKPELSMDRFADLLRAAERDVTQTTRLNEYALDFRPEPEDAVRLVCGRPEVFELLERGDGPEEFALSGLRNGYLFPDRRSFVLELVARLVRSSVLSGVPETVRRFEEVLERSAARNLPGLEATFVSGLSLDRRWDIAEGLSAVPYDEYRRGELSSSFATFAFDGMVHEAGNANRPRRIPPVAVLLQELRWGPAISRGFAKPHIKHLGNRGEPFDMAPLVNLLSVVGEAPLRVIGRRARAKRWFYELLDETIDIGMDHLVRSPVETLLGEGVELSEDGKAEFERLLPLWQGFAIPDRSRIDLAVSRLAGAMSRTGSLAGEDRVLDMAIAFEILYAMTNRTKLSKRVGAFLGGTPVERAAIESDVDLLYGWRVDIVHGLHAQTDRDSIAKTASTGSNLARRTLQAYLQRGSIPVRAEWTQLERTNAANTGRSR